MRRREFIAGVAGAAAWPLAARAQQRGKVPTVVFLATDATLSNPWMAAFVERLRELGWIEGRTNAGPHQRGRNQINQKFSFVTGTDRSNGD